MYTTAYPQVVQKVHQKSKACYKSTT